MNSECRTDAPGYRIVVPVELLRHRWVSAENIPAEAATSQQCFQPTALRTIAEESVLMHYNCASLRGQLPATVLQGLESIMEEASIYYKVFVTLEDDLCAHCMWEDTDYYMYPFDFNVLIGALDVDDYFTMNYRWNRFDSSQPLNLFCVSCGEVCRMPISRHEMSPFEMMLTGERVFSLYEESLASFMNENY